MLRHLHPSGLSFVSTQLQADIYLFNNYIFVNLSGLCLHVLYHWYSLNQIWWKQFFWTTTYISAQMSFLILTDWIPALSPSPAQHGGERGFWDRGAWFYGLCSCQHVYFVFLLMCCNTLPFFVSMWASFCQRTVCTTAAREPKSLTASWETCTVTLEVFYLLTSRKRLPDSYVPDIYITTTTEGIPGKLPVSQTWRLQ